SNVKTRGNIPGFLRSYLEKKDREFAASRDMKSFNNVLALLVYGLVLFLSTKNFNDFTVISVFWANDPVMLQKIVRAWGKVNKKGSDWKCKVGTGKETYSGSPEPIPISIEEADELKSTIAQLNKEKEELQASLLKATQENCELKWEEVRKD
ncbi:hypothetical protein A2U01_0006439, partial [Trifolium medium]|nr:hypothetical protein [Trifolium medium]